MRQNLKRFEGFIIGQFGAKFLIWKYFQMMQNSLFGISLLSFAFIFAICKSRKKASLKYDDQPLDILPKYLHCFYFQLWIDPQKIHTKLCLKYIPILHFFIIETIILEIIWVLSFNTRPKSFRSRLDGDYFFLVWQFPDNMISMFIQKQFAMKMIKPLQIYAFYWN